MSISNRKIAAVVKSLGLDPNNSTDYKIVESTYLPLLEGSSTDREAAAKLKVLKPLVVSLVDKVRAVS